MIASAKPLTHHAARQRWGVAQDWEGSVNDPRTHQEHGIRWNEKWIYLLPGGRKRLVYWNRYDCAGVLLEAPDGSVEAEPL